MTSLQLLKMVMRPAIALAVGMVAPIGTAFADCPATTAVQRDTTDPYQHVYDKLITDGNVLDGHGREASVSMDITATNVLLGFESINATNNGIYVLRFQNGGSILQCVCEAGNPGTNPPIPADECPLRLDAPDATNGVQHRHVSVELETHTSLGHRFFAGWQATPSGGASSVLILPRAFEFSPPLFDAFRVSYFGQVATPTSGTADRHPSVGFGSASEFYSLANSQRAHAERGLIRAIQTSGSSTETQVRCCGSNTSCPSATCLCPSESCAVQVDRWRGCLASRRRDGIHVYAWAEREIPDSAFSPFNIALRVYDGNGNLIDAIDRDQGPAEFKSVNQPSREIPSSDQLHPSCSIDDCGNIVVSWIGPSLLGSPTASTCTNDQPFAVYCRRLYFNLTGGNLEFKSQEFVVNSSDTWLLGNDPDLVHPVVSVCKTNRFDFFGSFIVAWNARLNGDDQWGVRAQFFDPKGVLLEDEFDLSPNPVASEPDGIDRTLAESNQHTVSYANHNVAAAWTENDSGSRRVWISFVTGTFIETPHADDVCIKGDCNHDEDITFDDVVPFIDILLGQGLDGCASYYDVCPADMDNNGFPDGRDIQCFTYTIIAGQPVICDTAAASYAISCDPNDPDPLAAHLDCNENGIHDAKDIKDGTSLDCNNNGVPDECDIDEGDPDDNGLVSDDVNSNGIPDECEVDCNHTGIPDDWDISEETSNDVNSNDIPDECEADCNGNDVPDAWDISTSASDDCNENGVPDECEDDCNGNDVPDDCDIADSTSEDCNENGIPDECDLSRSFLASFDCNENDVPDECDIANSTSDDENENGIPDECEEESLMGGGGESMMMGGGEGEGSEFDEAAAWELFFEWYNEQVFGEESDWGTLSGSQRFHRIMDELQLLGLPYAAPW